MAALSIDINLATQERKKHKNIFLVIGILGVVWLILLIIFPWVRTHHFSWVPLVPSIVQALIYALAETGLLRDRFPYLRINQEKIESFGGGFFAKPKLINWNEAVKVEVKLFEIMVSTTKRTETFDLTGLTDENLKIVKDFLDTLKAEKVF